MPVLPPKRTRRRRKTNPQRGEERRGRPPYTWRPSRLKGEKLLFRRSLLPPPPRQPRCPCTHSRIAACPPLRPTSPRPSEPMEGPLRAARARIALPWCARARSLTRSYASSRWSPAPPRASPPSTGHRSAAAGDLHLRPELRRPSLFSLSSPPSAHLSFSLSQVRLLLVDPANLASPGATGVGNGSPGSRSARI